MDPWHLSQLLIANSRLSVRIWAELDHTGVLSPFFYNMVQEHSLDPSFREALQAEIDLRSVEKDQEQRLLVRSLLEDTTYVGKLDTLLVMYRTDTFGSGPLTAYQLALSHGRTADVAALDAMLAQDDGNKQVRDMGAMLTALNYHWTSAAGADLAALETIAASGEELGRGAAWGILYALGATDTLPNGVLPMPYRTSNGDEELGGDGSVRTLMAYPDPAQDRVRITYPADAIGTLEVLDAQGRVALKVYTAGHPSFYELDVRSWAPGIYLARLVREDGVVIGETKCTVLR